LSSSFYSQVEIGREVALDALMEIARNPFVARRAMLLRMADKAVQSGEAFSRQV
jgi:hypothetical protein